MISCTHLLRLDAKGLKPVNTELLPVCKPLQIGARLAEKFKLHLLKLSGTEGKVSGSDLISEGLSNLSDTEGNFLSGGSLNILKVYENTLCSLGS